DIEQAVVDAWSKVLGISEIGPEDDFFALGGDSLPAVQVVMQLNQTFGTSLGLQDIFDHHTVAELAEVIANAVRQNAGNSAGLNRAASVTTSEADTPESQLASKAQKNIRPSTTVKSAPDWQVLERQNGSGLYPLSFPQESWWFLNQWAPASPDLSSCVLRLKGTLDVGALKRALSEFVGRHDALRTIFQSTENGPAQIIRAHNGCIDLPIVDVQAAEAETSAEQIIAEQESKPFDLASDLMLRPTLVRLASDDHALVLIAHHIAFDV